MNKLSAAILGSFFSLIITTPGFANGRCSTHPFNNVIQNNLTKVTGVVFPQERQVFQRFFSNQSATGLALVNIEVDASSNTNCIEVSAAKGTYGQALDWYVPDNLFATQNPDKSLRFTGTIPLTGGGWYTLTFITWQVFPNGTTDYYTPSALQTVSVNKMGVGEIFVAAGQSNSTNSGSCFLADGTTPGVYRPFSDLVTKTRDGYQWEFGIAPLLPLGSATYQNDTDPRVSDTDGSDCGSPWPIMADALVSTLHVPVAVASEGYGATGILNWAANAGSIVNSNPPINLRTRLVRTITNLVKTSGGYRGLLWHQGESDIFNVYQPGFDYGAALKDLIAATRSQTNFVAPFFVSKAAWYPYTSLSTVEAQTNPGVLSSALEMIQMNLVSGADLILAGVNTDNVITCTYRDCYHNFGQNPAKNIAYVPVNGGGPMPNDPHMNYQGLIVHGQRWYNQITSQIPFPSSPQ